MFGQLPDWFWVPLPPPAGAVEPGWVDGAGLAALTTATPAMVSRPTARSAEAMSRRDSDSRGADGVGAASLATDSNGGV